MTSHLRVAALVCLLAVPALAQEAQPLPPPPVLEAPPPAAPAAPAATVVKDTSVAVQVAVNIGLVSVDLQAGHFYGFLSGNIGVPLVTNLTVGAFAVGAGYTFALSTPGESMWFMDLFGLVNPGWLSYVGPFVGVGAGIGVRYLHRSGFTMGFKLPVLGGAISAAPQYAYGGGVNTAAAVGYFYLANAIALPVVSFGYRF